jgi:hypothetical protein
VLIILNVWAIESTFKTNHFGLPLFAVVAPYEMGIGMPLWTYMLCSLDYLKDARMKSYCNRQNMDKI